MVNRNFWGRNLNKCACNPDSECPICTDEEWDAVFIEEEYKEFQTLNNYDAV